MTPQAKTIEEGYELDQIGPVIELAREKLLDGYDRVWISKKLIGKGYEITCFKRESPAADEVMSSVFSTT